MHKVWAEAAGSGWPVSSRVLRPEKLRAQPSATPSVGAVPASSEDLKGVPTVRPRAQLRAYWVTQRS